MDQHGFKSIFFLCFFNYYHSLFCSIPFVLHSFVLIFNLLLFWQTSANFSLKKYFQNATWWWFFTTWPFVKHINYSLDLEFASICCFLHLFPSHRLIFMDSYMPTLCIFMVCGRKFVDDVCMLYRLVFYLFVAMAHGIVSVSFLLSVMFFYTETSKWSH